MAAAAVLLVAGLVYYLSSTREGYWAADDGKDDFVKMYGVYFNNASNCVVGELFKYTYSEVDKLVTDEQFRNNPAMKAVLGKCEYERLSSVYRLYADLLRATTCIPRNEFAEWFLATIPVKVLTPDEVEMYKQQYRMLRVARCWTVDKRREAFVHTKTRSAQLVRETFAGAPALAAAFLAEKKYDDWLNYVSAIVLDKNIERGVDPTEYEPGKLGAGEIDAFSVGGIAKIQKHAAIARKSFADSNMRCGAEKIVGIMVLLDIPFEADVNVTQVATKVLFRCLQGTS